MTVAAMDDMIKEKEKNNKVFTEYREYFTPTRELIREEFVILPDTIEESYDEKEKTPARMETLGEWYILRHEELKVAEEKKMITRNTEIPSPDSLYQRSDSDQSLKIRFTSHLRTVTAKSSGVSKLLSEKTIQLYIHSLFSEKEIGVLTALKRIYKDSGAEFKLCDFMFDPLGQKRSLDYSILLKTVKPETSGMKGSSASSAICGLLHLLHYFRTCALFLVLDLTNSLSVHRRTEYLHTLELAISQIKPNVRGNSKQAKLEAKITKKRERLADPDCVRLRAEGFVKYYMSEHMLGVLDFIAKMTKRAQRTTGQFLPKKSHFLRINKWLMIMLVYVNGQRVQCAGLLLDMHVLNVQRASVDKYDEIQLDREVLKNDDDLAQYTIGDISIAEKLGKTGKVELFLPQSVANAVTQFMYLKKRIFGLPTSTSNLFVDLEGKALTLNSIYGTNIMQEMECVMGIRVTATQRRRDICTEQRKAGCTGNTGVGNSADTQESIYNDRTEETGIRNKKIANKKILKKEALAYKYKELDAETREFLESQQKENLSLSRTMTREEIKIKEFRKNFKGTTKYSVHQKLLPIQRYRLIHSIYRLDNIEWSCLFFCGAAPPANPTTAHHFKRYLVSEGPEMDQIRIDMAQIAAHFPSDEDLFLKLTKVILNSFRQGY